MKILRIITILTLLVFSSSAVMAVNLATESDVARLKNDLLNGLIKVGKTRLKDLRRNYGDAPNITDDQSKVVYEYEDLKIEFTKEQYWTDWGYDGFKPKAYTDDIDDLREDLESEELVGTNITYTYVVREYGEPTESDEATDDGGISHYYYGDIRMTFENVYKLKKWRGKNLSEQRNTGILGGE